MLERLDQGDKGFCEGGEKDVISAQFGEKQVRTANKCRGRGFFRSLASAKA